MKNQKMGKNNESHKGKPENRAEAVQPQVDPAGRSDASDNDALDGAHSESLASITGIKLSVEDSHAIVLALPSSFIFYVKSIVIPLTVIAVLYALYYLSGIFFLFVISFFFAYVLNPLVIVVEKYLKNKTVSILSVYLVLFSLFMLLIIPAYLSLSTEISDFPNKMQRYSESFKDIYRKVSDNLAKSEDSWWMKSIKIYFTDVIGEPEDDAGRGAAAFESAGPAKKTESNGYEVSLAAANAGATAEVVLNSTTEISVNFLNKFNYFLKKSPKIEAFILGLFETVKDNLVGVSKAIFLWLGNLTAILFHYSLVPLLGYYFLADFKNLWAGFQHSIPAKFKRQTVRLIGQIDEVLGTFLRGQLVICLIVGTAFSFALAGIGVDFAFVIGPIAGICNIIYYLGPAMALIPSVLIAVLKWGLTFKALYKIFFIMTAILAIHLIDAFAFQPFIAEKSFSMHPLTLMLLLFIGFQLYGLFGMFIAIPLYGVGKVIYANFKIVYV